MQGMIESLRICKIKIDKKTFDDCGFLQAKCEVSFACFPYAIGDSEENPC